MTGKSDAPSLTLSQFQYEVKKNCYQDLHGLLQKDYKSAMPGLDPTQGKWLVRVIPPSLTVSQFQYEVKKNHYQDLHGLLQKDYKSAMPVLDPTQGK